MKKVATRTSLAAALIMAGVGFLLVRFDVLSPAAASRGLHVWPVLLVVWGLEAIWRARDRQFPTLIGPALVVAVVALAWLTAPGVTTDEGWGLAVRGEARQVESDDLDPQGGAVELAVAVGAADLEIAATDGNRVVVEYEGFPPVIEQRSGLVRVREDSRDGWIGCGFPGHGRNVTWRLKVPARVPLRFALEAGASDVKADLSGAQLRAFEVSAGASDIAVSLPAVQGELPVRFETGASDIEVAVPKDAAVRLVTNTALGHTKVHGLALVDTGAARETPDYASSPSRIAITVEGGVSGLEITRR